jgi:hypothetical protein
MFRQVPAKKLIHMPPLALWGGGMSLAIIFGCYLLLHNKQSATETGLHRGAPNSEQRPGPEGGHSAALFPARDFSRENPNTENESAASSQNDDAETGPGVMSREELLRELRKWAARDIDAALAWMANLADQDLREGALESICYGLAESNPARAVKLATSFRLQDRPRAVLENLVQQWAVADVPSALAWATNQPAGEQRDECMARVALVYSRSVPADAARLVVEQIPPGAVQTESAMMVLHQWATQDLAAAASWVDAFPDGPLRVRAVAELEGISKERDELMRQGGTNPRESIRH